MNIQDIKKLRSGILAAAYKEDTSVLEMMGIHSSQLLSDVTQLKGLEHWNNIAVGYSFSAMDAESARLEIRVPSTSKRAIRAANTIAKEVGSENANIRYIKSPAILSNGPLPPGAAVSREIYPGASVGSENGTGSLGGFALDEDGKLHIISCSHVLAYHPSTERKGNLKGQAIYHPGPIDKAPLSNNHIATLQSHTVFSEKWVHKSDSACALVVSDIPAIGNIVHHQYGIDFSDPRIYEPPMNDDLYKIENVYKIGKTTGLTRGTISAIDIEEYSIAIESSQTKGRSLQLRFGNVIEIRWEDEKPFSRAGDSGGLLFCEIGGKLHALGLVFASSRVKVDEKAKDYASVTLACSMSNVLEEHTLSWFNDAE